MKKLYIVLFLTLTVIAANAQSFAGKKMLTTTLSMADLTFAKAESANGTSPAQTFKSSYIGLAPEFTYGKVNAHNLLVAYGVSLSYSRGANSTGAAKTVNTAYGAGPTLLLQKFIPITSRIFYSPLGNVSAFYRKEKTNMSDAKQESYSANMHLRPLSVTFQATSKTNILLLAGSVGLFYSNTKTTSPQIAGESVSRNSSVAVNVSANYFGIGFQRVI